MQLAPADMLQDAVELLCGEAVLRMIHTHAGSRVGCMVAAYSSPKERKKLLKAMKGHVVKMCLDEFAYITLIKLLAVVDDTQLVQKCAISEIVVRASPALHLMNQNPAHPSVVHMSVCAGMLLCGTSAQCLRKANGPAVRSRRAC
jgi:pumilio homology domain family member 6